MTRRPQMSPGTKDEKKLAAQRKAQAEIDRERAEYGQAWCRLLQTWRLCAKSACRRKRECQGDAHDCFENHWRQVPEENRVWLRAGLKARHDGESVQQAMATANAEALRWRETQARYAAPSPAPVPPPQCETPREPHMPRIRVL